MRKLTLQKRKKRVKLKSSTLEEKKQQTAALQTSLEKQDADLAARIAAYQAEKKKQQNVKWRKKKRLNKLLHK